MGSFSLLHWIIVLAVVLLLFGPKRLPDLAKGVGESIREFKKAVSDPQPSNVNHQLTQGQSHQGQETLATPTAAAPQPNHFNT